MDSLVQQLEDLKTQHAREVKALQDENLLLEQQLIQARCEASKNAVFRKQVDKLREEAKALRQENLELRKTQIALAERTAAQHEKPDVERLQKTCKTLKMQLKEAINRAQL